MKTTMFILTFIFSVTTIVAQISQVDSLIKQLNNSQVALGGDYVGATISFAGEPSIKLFNIGKPVTEKLISILEDSTKGIIAHCILTSIWGKSDRPTTAIYIEKKKITVYTENQLNLFVGADGVYANSYDLKFNQLLWQSFLKENRR